MYKIKNTSTTNLINKGFRYIGDGVYILRFPIYFYKNTPTTFCEATIIPEYGKRINIDVKRANGTPYYHWYVKDKNAQILLDAFDDAIDKKMRKIGARKYAD